MSRPNGAKNFHPGETELRHLVRMLRRDAEAGDNVAAGFLVLFGVPGASGQGAWCVAHRGAATA
ncbi:MAG: hypothetical protein QNK18_12555 [Gammaproteobacteria bacterium]|nr:hypothetical protein [Gammaproteobacteria bacterium]